MKFFKKAPLSLLSILSISMLAHANDDSIYLGYADLKPKDEMRLGGLNISYGHKI